MKRFMLVCLVLLALLVPSGAGSAAAAPAFVAFKAAPPPPATPGLDPPHLYVPFLFRPGKGSVEPGGLPVISSFAASPVVIQPGQSSQLSWSVSGAISLTLSPGVGAVTGASLAVNPEKTTDYTLTATNAAGSVQAKAKVTVQQPESASGFFFPGLPDIDRPTSHPTVAVDPQGGVHISLTPDSNTPADPERPAYYAYCPSNCNHANAFTLTRLGQDVTFANLALDPTGKPRLLLTVGIASDTPHYAYAACDGGCTNALHWTVTPIAGFTPSTVWSVQFGRFFDLDAEGRPRFVYQDQGDGAPEAHAGNFYAYCNSACTNPANWYETPISGDLSARAFDLALSPFGEPRLVWTSYDAKNMATYLAYWECTAGCTAPEDWRGVRLLDTVSASVSEYASYALEITSKGKPRLMYYTGSGVGGSFPANYMYYLSCDATDCTQLQDWYLLDLGFPFTHGEEGVDLALDPQDRPRLAYHAPLAAGYGLFYAWCNTSCESSAAGWQYQEIEPSEQVNRELPIPPRGGCSFPLCDPPEPACTISSWDNGVRPSLALDPAGHPRIAYDADHEQGGACTSFTDTRLTRFTQFSQP